ncbi:MAG TPA: hypothetical protein PKW98_09190 [Candidatus Wallbacteria bacterium]|nr:MAG: hypothetical protein BWY32_00005 [bacterium ADurb.Bin243]HPG57982.1 hypothetical protein [Candidatus Wallbacteria bacterium]
MVKHFGIKKMAALVMVVFAMAVLAGCGGGSSNAVVNEQVPLSGSNTVIAESVKVEKTGDTVTVNYQTSSPVKKAYVVTSDFAFNNAPLWSEFNEVKTEDGLKHTATFKTAKKTSFMIYASPQDKFDNGGKGIEIK